MAGEFSAVFIPFASSSTDRCYELSGIKQEERMGSMHIGVGAATVATLFRRDTN